MVLLSAIFSIHASPRISRESFVTNSGLVHRRSRRESIGAGPNKYLAKIASKMRKPDGLFIIEHRDLPGVLNAMDLRDLTGIGCSSGEKPSVASAVRGLP